MELLEKPKPKTVWDLKVGDNYYLLMYDKTITHLKWSNLPKENIWRNQGHIFLTQEEAEFESKRIEVYTKVKKYARPFVKDKNNWYPFYCYAFEKIMFDKKISIKEPALYFESRDIIEKAINEVGKEDFIKYYLGVNVDDNN